ncbi:MULTISPECIES: hypothetical protein [Sphaerospermopsis]|uniref:Uncharacterized protein n=1 Tax=Sphaerospermopsis reniformis TaxID=531300 RepID=A0A480A9V6_9CYAN|nr:MULTISPECIES: hypothetical protein [Sphaerospermopsis]MBD2133867.1 hypothetical protein [Sphaerospermopsis sp. FACHB-1094]MBD2143705.1 hypothetical protein [Sphaerospermopsis sp. FACHB-1194]GCL38924.1 hypothetical protein SR1949_40440 [Sphaerospermopsis reniformis]
MTKKSLNLAIRLSLMIVTLGVTTVMNSIVNAEEVPPIFGDITINRQFSPDPLTVRGMSGGSVPASKVNGETETPTGSCTGFVDEDQDHTLKLLSKFDYLKLQVESKADTTIMIKGPGGIWCNDDFDGKNPGIVGEWLEGIYKIWIGSYEKEKYFPYTLKITEVK